MAERLHKEAYDASPTCIITARRLFKTPSLILFPSSSTRAIQQDLEHSIHQHRKEKPSTRKRQWILHCWCIRL